MLTKFMGLEIIMTHYLNRHVTRSDTCFGGVSCISIIAPNVVNMKVDA